MNVSTTNIWKAANAAARQSPHARDAKLHLGETLRTLYVDEKTPKTDGRFADLLSALDTAENDGHSGN